MNGTLDPATSVATEAAEWYARLRAPDVSEIEAVRFRAWLAGDPARRREFDAIDAFWQDLAAIKHTPEVSRVRQSIAARYPKQSRRRSLALAAAVLGAVVGVAGWQYWFAGRYATNIGEQRMVPLADGSIVTLNTSTQIRLHYTDGLRHVELVQGQANFDVASDPGRPFIVTAGDGAVRALGTVFDVYKAEDRVTVTLLEGKVAVAPRGSAARDTVAGLDSEAPKGGTALDEQDAASSVSPSEILLKAGEQISFAAVAKVAAAPQVVKLASVDVPRVTAWKARKLDFSDTPILDAIAEANRYSRAKIVLHAPDLVNARISGTFEAGKNEAFVEGLQTYFKLEVERAGGDRIILTRRRDP